MAKSPRKSNREVRKPKVKKPKSNASNPSLKLGLLATIDSKKVRF
jgi:hypothetical protein